MKITRLKFSERVYSDCNFTDRPRVLRDLTEFLLVLCRKIIELAMRWRIKGEKMTGRRENREDEEENTPAIVNVTWTMKREDDGGGSSLKIEMVTIMKV